MTVEAAKTAFDAGELVGRDGYKLLTGLIVPRPIAWVATVDLAGRRNLAPFSFFNGVSSSPPMVMFSTVRPEGRSKDTLANVDATGEFTVNLVTEEVAQAMNATSGGYPPGTDEFEIAGVTAVPSDLVRPPRVGEAAANMECRLDRIIDVGRLPLGASVVFGEVLRFHVRDDVLDGTRIDPVALRAIGRMAGSSYVTTGDSLFDMPRPD